MRLTFLLPALALPALVMPAAAAGEEPAGRPLTLAQAVETALENSRALSAADAGLAAARAGVAEARSARLPKVEVTEAALRTTNPVEVFGSLLGQEAFTAESFALDRLNEPDALTNFNTRLSVTQPLWTGGRITNGLAAARLGEESAAAQRERRRQEVVHQVVDAYTGAVVARRHLEVAHEALETARAHVKLVEDLYTGGLVVESDLLQAQVRASEIEEMVVRAESGVAVSEAALNLAMGGEQGRHWQLAADVEPKAPAADELDALIAEAWERRPDLAATAAQVEAAGRLVKLERAGFLPEIGLNGFYEANSEDVLGTDGTNWSVTVGLRFTAFDGMATRARVRQAREKARQAEELAALEREHAALEVRTAFHEVAAAGKRLALATAAKELAARNLTIVEDRYREGLTTLVELLDAETALTEARTREVAGRRDLLRSQATLDLAVGRL